ncbi:protein ZNRD2 [Corvus cornix cornix]|uniref:protein ZNRD2 n=1 Tax=Corvus cornix cornix TaxID=932674 RepID=UPI00194E1694|nr:protein ZNRD2 [Corvus cornix cornix]
MALNGGADEAEARRERQDRASRAMGGLLLRGYRMLGSACPRCGTILLQDKEQRLLCVTCQDPEGPGGGHAAPPPPAPGPSTARGRPRLFGALPRTPRAPRIPRMPGGGAVGAARAALLQKLLWAAQELPRTASLEASAQLCGLVRACADALGGLQALDPPPARPSPPETLRPLPSPHPRSCSGISSGSQPPPPP